MNRAAFLHRLGLGFLAGLFARESSATTDLLPGAPDTADGTGGAHPTGLLNHRVEYEIEEPVSLQEVADDLIEQAMRGYGTRPDHGDP